MSIDSTGRNPSYRRQEQDDGEQGFPAAKTFAIIFLVIAYAIPITYSIRLPHQGINGAYAVGYLSGPLVILLGILFFATRGAKRIRDVLFLILAVLACVWSALNCYRTWEDNKALHNSVKNIQNIMDNIEGKGGQTADAPADSARTTASGEDGKLAVVMNALGQNMKHFAQNVQAIQAKAAQPEYQLDTVLAPENFADPKLLAESRQHLANYHDLISQRQQACKDYIRDAEAIINNADASPKTRDDMMGGFQHGRQTSMDGFKRLDDAQLGVLQSASSLLDLAERGMGKNQVRNGKLLFATDADLAAYKAGVAQVQKYAADEEAAQQYMQQQGQNARKNLETIGQ